MSKSFMRFIAVLVLFTLNAGAPAPVRVDEKNSGAAKIFNYATADDVLNFIGIRSAEASYNNFDIVNYSGIKADEDDTFLGRLGIIGKVMIGIIGLVLLITCWPILVGIAIIWAVVNWLFFGPEKK